ncbi:MAG: SDR family NAD(P)-dependent oxidoreductase [Candidatus Lokiarchaeota archaeon]|nr:SDR family NAD(P)-dependent oxidoreductase [Candidatus Lokiarchaeota archaeon]
MVRTKWNIENIPDQSGKIVIVTGANSGTGFEVAKALAMKGAKVIMACRNLDKANNAKSQIMDEYPHSNLKIIQLDLGSLSSIRKFGEDFTERFQELHILCNNAGVMMPPYQKTDDGFELQFGVNHLGHFALTGLLLNTLLNTKDSRVVTMSSTGHKLGKIHFDDLNWENDYNRTRAYGMSKLANLLFAYELQRNLQNTGKSTISLASHPGWTRTNLQRHVSLFRLFNPLLAQKPQMGALPMLYAATSMEAQGGGYYGPGGIFEIRGYPKKVKSNKRSYNKETAKKLWQISEELTGVKYVF